MATKKLTRKELLNQPDEFISFSSKLLGITVKYKTQILYTIFAMALLGVALSGYSYFARKSEKTAFAMLEKAKAQYGASLVKDGPQKALNDVKDNFTMIIGKYSGSLVGKLAGLELANMYYNAGDIDLSIDGYGKSLKVFSGNSMVKCQILNSLGYAYEVKNDLKTAVYHFEMVVSEPDNYLKDEALFNLARIYAVLGDETKSKSAYRRIVSDFTGSFYLEIAKERIS
jgi:tetratricopeptide (TPR) repeat protein